MKKIKPLFLILIAAQLLWACKKEGKLIEVKGYGTIAISSTTSPDVGVLLIDIDGKITDTLKAPTTNKDIKIYTGSRRVKIYQQGKSNTPVIDTTFDVKDKKTNLKFIYTGDVTIIGGGYDGTVKPAKGNSLVQFVNLEKALPALVDAKIYELYFDETGTYFADEVASVKNIAKNKFSTYIEIPPVKHGDFSSGYYYSLFNSANGEKLVDALTDYPFIYWAPSSFALFQPNKVVSLGILIDQPAGGYYSTTVIYDTEIK